MLRSCHLPKYELPVPLFSSGVSGARLQAATASGTEHALADVMCRVAFGLYMCMVDARPLERYA